MMWQNKYDGGGVDKAWDIKVVVSRGCASNVLGGGGDIPCWDIDIYVTGESAGIGTSNDFRNHRDTLKTVLQNGQTGLTARQTLQMQHTAFQQMTVIR